MPKFIDNLYVRDSSKVTREIADKDGYLYQRNSKITATATELNTLSGTEKAIKTKKVALGVADTGGGVLSWQNPEGAAIIIERLIIDVTTASTAACTVDFGTTAVGATTSSDNLIDGLDVNAATGTFDNITDKGDNGKSRQKLASGKWVTGSMKTGAAAGLAGYAYIQYIIA